LHAARQLVVTGHERARIEKTSIRFVPGVGAGWTANSSKVKTLNGRKTNPALQYARIDVAPSPRSCPTFGSGMPGLT
jgi:hypothetical protein